jgi:hypothetical protein
MTSWYLASFDRRKCQEPLNGPGATGKPCPEGWTLYAMPRPQFQGLTDHGSAQASYYSRADQHNPFRLSRGVPFATGNLTESIEVLVDESLLPCAFPIPRVVTRTALMDASTIRKRAGRAEECGRTTLAGEPVTSRAAKGRNP